MRVVLASALVLAILIGPVRAQISSNAPQMDPLQLQYEAERRDRLENERKYNETMKHIRTPAPTTKADPWRGVRSDETNNKKQ